MKLTVHNIVGALPRRAEAEHFETLAKSDAVEIKRIISAGHTTPEGEWYDQVRDEWVMVAHGAARMIVEGESEELTLNVGDWVLIPAGCRHRVTWTTPETETVWLAVHLS